MNTTNETAAGTDKEPAVTLTGAASAPVSKNHAGMLVHSVKQSIESIHSIEDKLNAAYDEASIQGMPVSRPSITVMGSADQSRSKHSESATVRRQNHLQGQQQKNGAILVSDNRLVGGLEKYEETKEAGSTSDQAWFNIKGELERRRRQQNASHQGNPVRPTDKALGEGGFLPTASTGAESLPHDLQELIMARDPKAIANNQSSHQEQG